jgi:hypothetical protein
MFERVVRVERELSDPACRTSVMRSIEWMFDPNGTGSSWHGGGIPMNGTAHTNHIAQTNRTGHLTLVPTPTAAELRRMVDLDDAVLRERRPTGRPAVSPTVRPAVPAGLRLTRRGRLVMVVLFLLALFGGGVLFGTGSKAGASDQAGAPHQYVVVQPGQTLWGIAKQVAPGTDPRVTVEAIRRLNALPDGGVQAGQRIALP